ncbi:MAG: response regulator [Marinilabiliaceae bacterium]|nr:response regulator [Marinilabiliaceae bacterium]
MKRNWQFQWFFIIIIFFSIGVLSGQAPQNQYKFSYLTIDQGLSNNSIRTICQDSKGFIWFGTQNGLNKYDGQSIVTYWHNPNDSNSISANLINSVFQDSKGNIWIANEVGLDRYSIEHDNFARYKCDKITWPVYQIFSVTEDKYGRVWFGGTTGLYGCNFTTGNLLYFNTQRNDSNGVFPNAIISLLPDDDKLWISVSNSGLYVYNQVDSTFEIYKNDPNDYKSISGNRIESLFKDSKGNIWVGMLNNGLNRYDPSLNSFIRYLPDIKNPYSTRVRAMFEDLKGDFFIGTRGGLYIFDKGANHFVQYASEDHNFSKLSQNSIRSAFVDNSNTLWLGTFSGGVNYTYLNKKEFTHYISGKYNNQYLNGANIYCITEDSANNLWVGGDNGLNFLDRKTYTFKYYQNNPNDPQSLSYNDVKALEWDKQGNLWIGTNRGGLNYYDVTTGIFKTYRHNNNDINSISGDKVYCLFNDKNNNLWIITTPSDDYTKLVLDVLPDGKDYFVHLKEKPYFGFDQDKYGNMFIGSRKGFYYFNKVDSVFDFFSSPDIIGNVNVLKVDSKGTVWVGSTKGLARFVMSDQSFKGFSKETGFPIDEVYGILEDDSGNLWISSISGLIKMTNAVSDINKIKIRVFDQYDGLQSKQFNFNAYYKCRSGEMVFGGINGFNTFFPDRIIENNQPVDVVITDLKINNESVPIGTEFAGSIILDKSIAVTERIVLGPNHKIVTLEFASLHSVNPDKYAYKTMLIGLEKDWQFRKAGNNIVTYTNLAPGNYTFMVSAANDDGIWNEKPVNLSIIVVPPFYETWFFRIFVVLAVAGMVLFIYYYRLGSMKRQNVLLENTVAIRTKQILEKNELLHEVNILLTEKQEEIVAQNEELENNRNNLERIVDERTRELKLALERATESDALKSAFLANMSHEIRTPMNAIVGFSNLINDEGVSNEERVRYVNIILSNSNSLLKIIDEILDLSLIESNQLKIVKEVFDLNVMLDHIYSYYVIHNNNKSVSINLDNKLEEQNLILNSDLVRIRQILTNLMDNACKFTNEGYIDLGVYVKNGLLNFYVKDSGKGIPTAVMDTVFQQFTKIEDDKFGWKTGLGLGLAIAQKTADALGGKILVESIEGKGSKFTFSIPLKIVMSKNEMSEIEVYGGCSVDWSGKTILIAEDIEANYIFLKSVLKKTKAKIFWEKNGEEAVTQVRNNPQTDLVLMDIKMPVKNGYDAAKEIKEMNSGIIIVAQTAYARPMEKNRFYDDNFDEYLSKPIDPKELFRTIGKFI